MTNKVLNPTQLSELAINALQDLKGKDIVKLDLREIDSAVTDFFIIATGTSDRHVQSLSDSVLATMKKDAEEFPITKEGLAEGEWSLVDYGSVVVHVFQQTQRDFYRLESLWGDAPSTTYADVA
ncbi:MAG: ribosome silencing factor [Bacteroidia bacterium]